MASKAGLSAFCFQKKQLPLLKWFGSSAQDKFNIYFTYKCDPGIV